LRALQVDFEKPMLLYPEIDADGRNGDEFSSRTIWTWLTNDIAWSSLLRPSRQRANFHFL